MLAPVARADIRITLSLASAVVIATPETPAALGRVVATEKKPNTPHEFHFWTALESPVGIGTIVRVEGRPVNGQVPHIFGVVVEGFSFQVLRADSRKLHALLVEKPKAREPE